MRQEWDIPLLGLGSSLQGVKLSGLCLSAEDGTSDRPLTFKTQRKSRCLAHCNWYLSTAPKVHKEHYCLYMARFVWSGKQKAHPQKPVFLFDFHLLPLHVLSALSKFAFPQSS